MSELLSALQQTDTLPIFCGVVGLVIGSCLNVVAYRLPLLLQYRWRSECREYLELPADRDVSSPWGLWWPPSACPSCGRGIRPHENIPLLSYLLLRGKCAGCDAKISPTYPVVEVLTALLFAALAWRYGATFRTGAALTLTAGLIGLSVIDLRHQLLPDSLTLPLLWLGLLLGPFAVFVDSDTAIIGAVAGYLSLWLVYRLFKLCTGKEGMGYGDFKLLAVLGAWFGWQTLPFIIAASAAAGIVLGGGAALLIRERRGLPIPYGPFLAVAGIIVLFTGTQTAARWL